MLCCILGSDCCCWPDEQPARAGAISLQTGIIWCVSCKDTCECHHQISNDIYNYLQIAHVVSMYWMVIATDPTKTIHRRFAYKKVVQFLYKDLWTVFSPLLAHDPASPKNTIKTNGFEARFFCLNPILKFAKFLTFLAKSRPRHFWHHNVLQNRAFLREPKRIMMKHHWKPWCWILSRSYAQNL